MKSAIDIIIEITKEQLPMLSDGAIEQLALTISNRLLSDNLVEYGDKDIMFAKRLKYLREEMKITQKELGEKLGISSSAIGMYESEKRNPDTSMLNIMADFFDVSVDYILGRTNIKKNNIVQKEPTIAIHSDYEYDELPEEAKKEIENFLEFVTSKYKK